MINRYTKAVLNTLQILIPPLLLSHAPLESAPWQFYIYILTAILIAVSESFQQTKTLIAAGALAFVVGFGQWMLIPLLLTQVLLASLLITQQLAQHIHETLWLIIAFFMQLVGMAALTQGLPPLFIWTLALGALLTLTTLWTSLLPTVATLLIALLLVVVGYATQQVSLLAGIGMLIVAYLSTLKKVSAWKPRGRLANLLYSVLIYVGTLQG